MTTQRGGKREGAGRKKSEPTEVIRVPISLINEVKALIQQHKTLKNSVSSPKKAENERKKPINTVKKPKMALEIEVNGKLYPVKYAKLNQYGAFDYWHGKGRKPKWLVEHLNHGGTLADTLVIND